MTTKNEVVDSLTAQGKTTSQEEAPPQTIIGTFNTIDSLNKAGLDAMTRTGDNRLVIDGFKKKFGCGLNSLPIDKWQEAGEWFASLDPIIPAKVDAGAEGIIPLSPEQIDNIAGTFYGDGISVVDRQFARKIEEAHGIGGQKIIPTIGNGYANLAEQFNGIPFSPDPDRPIRTAQQRIDDVFNKSFTQLAFEAEQRRQTVQAEAMVNLAVGVTLMKMGALEYDGRSIGYETTVSAEDLIEFQRNYTVTQEIQPDGGFIISVSPKEV